MSVPSFAIPGDRLASTSSHAIGQGTYADSSTLFASLVGPVEITSASKPSLSSLSVSQKLQSGFNAALPTVGDQIVGRITRTNPRQATLDILAVGASGQQPFREPFQALIRQQDIRATEIDKVKVAESFRVGDIVRGVVISLGDERNYYVSTARNEFGVVIARSEGGGIMVPISWREMKDLRTGITEARKVAKVV